MGIKGLSKFLTDTAPGAILRNPITHYAGKTVAIDSKMWLYKFNYAIRSDEGSLTNSEGVVTSYLLGTFHRTIWMLQNGIKPINVFDGKPPVLKNWELKRRAERRAQGQAQFLAQVEQSHMNECQKLLRHMGIPSVCAPGEAEAQCVELVNSDVASAVVTEDMDALPFGSPVLLRHLSSQQKNVITEYRLDRILNALDMNLEEFTDFCILVGCDYTEKIPGIGPKNAYKLIQKHRSIEEVLLNIKEKQVPPKKFLFDEVRKLFKSPEVTPAKDIPLTWTAPDKGALIDYLCHQNGFSQRVVTRGYEKLLRANEKIFHS